jgi:putative YphP/YqiW family bacilliredoxin
MYPPELVQPMKDDLTSVGFNQLVSPDEVDEIIENSG